MFVAGGEKRLAYALCLSVERGENAVLYRDNSADFRDLRTGLGVTKMDCLYEFLTSVLRSCNIRPPYRLASFHRPDTISRSSERYSLHSFLRHPVTSCLFAPNILCNLFSNTLNHVLPFWLQTKFHIHI